jgi:6-hydroxy-3-succinoylpyridine 3-monooxygenase
MKTFVYVDGFNLYYELLRGTAFKWLDLYGLFQDHVLGATVHVEKVRYYTAPVKGSASDDPKSPQRQRIYLRALKAYRGDRVDIIQGSIVRTTPILAPHSDVQTLGDYHRVARTACACPPPPSPS